MKLKLIYLSILLLLISTTIFAKPVDINKATKVTQFKLELDNKDNYIIENTSIIYNKNNEEVAYLFNLHPQGFIITSNDTDITPIAAYSYLNNFSTEEVEQNVGYYMIREGLSLRLQAVDYMSHAKIESNNLEWQKYENKDTSFFDTKDRQIWPPAGSSPTGGWVETQWNQDPYPYNTFCPLDDVHGGRCVVGCIATAMAQVMNYHRYIGNAMFDDADDYYSANSGGPYIYIDNDYIEYEFPNFPLLNSYLAVLRAEYTTNAEICDNSIAALGFAAGVSVEMKYSADGSGAYSIDARNAFLNKFNYDSANLYYENPTSFYNMLKTNMMNAQPSMLSISGNGHHSIICDGYNDGDDTYHLNYGWGGNNNGWYTLPGGMPGGFSVVESGIMDIEGGIYPYLEFDELFIQEQSGDDDGNLNPGEDADLRIRLTNRESFSTATDITAKLRTDDSRITIIDSEATYNNISSGSSGINFSDPFSISVSADAGACSVPCVLHVESNTFYSADLNFNIEVTLDQYGWPVTLTNGVIGSPAFTDFNQDNTLDVTFGDKNGNVRRYDIEGDEYSGFPVNTGNQIFGSVAIADIDENGVDNIIAGSMSKNLYVLEPDGSTLFTYTASNNIICTPAVSDIDNNNSLEIIFQTISKDLYVLDNEGEPVSGFPVNLTGIITMNSGVAVGDIYGDSNKEIIVGLTNGDLICVNNDGSIEWTITLDGSINGAPTIVKFVDQYKIVAGTSSGTVYIVDPDGSTKNSFSLSGDLKTSPVVINTNAYHNINDLLIIIANASGNLYVTDWNGNIRPGFPYSAGGLVESTPIIADIDNNGVYDIIFGSNDKYLHGVGIDGNLADFFPININNEIKSPPSIADADEDGDLEIAFGNINGMSVIDYKAPGDTGNILWNTYRNDYKRTGFADCSYPSGINPEIDNFKNYISQNYPNPFASSTKIKFGLKKQDANNVRVKIYNILGQLISEFKPEAKAGSNEFSWEGRDNKGNKLSSGIYFYQLQTDTYKSEIKKLILTR